MMKERLCWKIEGRDGETLIFEAEVSYGCMTERQMQITLKCLAAKAGLSYEEIVCSNAKKKTKIAKDLLSVEKDVAKPVYRCGENPYFTARVVKLLE